MGLDLTVKSLTKRNFCTSVVGKIKMSTGFQNRSKEVILTSQTDNAKNSVSYFYLRIMV